MMAMTSFMFLSSRGRPPPLQVVAALPVHGDVEAVAFLLLRHPQTHCGAQHRRDQKRAGRREQDGGQDPDELLEELPGVAAEQARHRDDTEHAGGERAPDATHAVYPEGVERIVIAESALETHGTVAHERGERS